MICSYCDSSCQDILYLHQTPVIECPGVCARLGELIIRIRMIDIDAVVNKIPHEILVKIYNEYFRPIKFYQLYKAITVNYISLPIEWAVPYQNTFAAHLGIFLYKDIGEYIKHIDPEFRSVINSFYRRNKTSVFARIPNRAKSLYVELVMTKYH